MEYYKACKPEYQPLNWSNSQLTCLIILLQNYMNRLLLRAGTWAYEQDTLSRVFATEVKKKKTLALKKVNFLPFPISVSLRVR